jgi:hypothetical protein
MQNLGLVGVKSVHGKYLQAHKDNGEMHASNSNRNEEETWFLIEVDKANHIYALQNWDNHNYLSKKPPHCQRADVADIGATEQWILVSGQHYGVGAKVGIRCLADKTFMGANDEGDDTECGGEVMTKDAFEPPQGDGGWPGWWTFEAASTPEPGRDFWNAAGGVLVGVAIDALSAALLS